MGDTDLRAKVQRLLTELARGEHKGHEPDCSVCWEIASVRAALVLEDPVEDPVVVVMRESAMCEAIRERERAAAKVLWDRGVRIPSKGATQAVEAVAREYHVVSDAVADELAEMQDSERKKA